jgi:hypothetical protein
MQTVFASDISCNDAADRVLVGVGNMERANIAAAFDKRDDRPRRTLILPAALGLGSCARRAHALLRRAQQRGALCPKAQRDKLRDSEWVKNLAKEVTSTYQKLVARKTIKPFGEEWKE